MIYRQLTTLLALTTLLVALSCRGGAERVGGPVRDFQPLELDEFQITFTLPSSWRVIREESAFFQLRAYGLGPHLLPVTLEYRGILSADGWGGSTQKALYARGWYEAMGQNYPNWNYLHRNKIDGDEEGAFQFEGTYRVATDEFRKIGYLFFRGRRVHAIYLTSYNREYELVEPLFLWLRDQIRFH